MNIGLKPGKTLQEQRKNKKREAISFSNGNAISNVFSMNDLEGIQLIENDRNARKESSHLL